MTRSDPRPNRRAGRQAGPGAAAGAPRRPSPNAALVERNLARPHELARKLIMGEALGERPVRAPFPMMPGRPRRR